MKNSQTLSTPFFFKLALRRGLASLYMRTRPLLPFRFMQMHTIAALDRAIRQKLKASFAFIDSHAMFLDPADALQLSLNGVYEPLATQTIKRLIAPGNTVLDIGAHIGYYTLPFARIVGLQGKVFAFEPDPGNFTLLQRNVFLNGYQNVTLIEKGVADRDGKTKLYLSPINTGDHRIYDSDDSRPYVEVDITSLDAYFRTDPPRIDFMKMDIQGAELAALRGMRSLLARNSSPDLLILVEYSPAHLRLFGDDPQEFLEFFVAAGFTLFNVNERHRKLTRTTVEELLRTYTGGRLTHANVLCIKPTDRRFDMLTAITIAS